MPIITLTTDYGTSDHYVAAMKGVLLSLAPKATLVDVTHELPPAGLLPAAFLLSQLPATFPPGTVHLAAIDPTVGTKRAILAARSAGQFFVAPDNGLLTLVQQRWGLEGLTAIHPPPAGRRVSETFHGRDLMAPVAAELANRGRLEEVGFPTDRMELLDVPPAGERDGEFVGQVIHVDRFGNCTTNIPQERVRAMVARSPGLTVLAGDVRIGPPVKTYADVPPGSPLALVGSADLLEVAVNLGSAEKELSLKPGSPVALRYT
ncbi:MAG: SAM-dependent chlorinase/fluorinase [Phycisphaerae bacterium]|nr:SAM-dependent chlorinase/fluorinase [Phycisphaerae bacterium]